MGEERIVWLNHNKCSGCNLCILICSYSKENKFSLESSRITLAEQEEYGFSQTLCRNCEDAPCIDACPAGAINRREDNFVVLNEKRCVNCNMCVMVCPFNAIGTTDKFNFKCDTCDGKERCAQICYHGAIKFGNYKKLIQDKRRLMLDRIGEP